MDAPAPANSNQAILLALIKATTGNIDREALIRFLAFIPPFIEEHHAQLPETAALLKDAIAVLIDDEAYWIKMAET